MYWHLISGNLTIRVRCIDTYGGYSEAYQKVTVVPPTKIDVNALANQLSTLADEQNMGQLVALASTFVSTLTTGGTELSEEQKELQMAMTDSVTCVLCCHTISYPFEVPQYNIEIIE